MFILLNLLFHASALPTCTLEQMQEAGYTNCQVVDDHSFAASWTNRRGGVTFFELDKDGHATVAVYNAMGQTLPATEGN